jgi:DNA-binding transcriptional LysR family regulator
MMRLVVKGMGIGVIPREYALRRLNCGELYELKTDPALPARSVGMLLPKNTAVSYALHSFLEYFHKDN